MKYIIVFLTMILTYLFGFIDGMPYEVVKAPSYGWFVAYKIFYLFIVMFWVAVLHMITEKYVESKT